MYSFPRFTRLISLLAAVISVTTIFAATAPTPAPLPAMTATKVPGSPFKFEIVAPTTAYTNESIDVTVRVVDKDGTVVPSYHGTILFNSSDLKAELPYQSLGYQLRPEDRGEKVFSKGVNFKNIGSFNLEVNDINDDISGSVKVKVEARDTPLVTPVGSGSDVVILTPEDGSTQAGKDVTITGKTKKNSKVGIFLNGKDAGNVISDTDGSFIKTATNLTEKEYILQVKLYDSTNMVVASSKETKFSFANELPTFAGISITEGTTVETGTGLHILVDAEGGLASVKVTLDTVTLSLTETQPGKYTTTTTAPSKAGIYTLDVNLANNLAQTLDKPKVLSLTVTEKPIVFPKFQNIKAENSGSGGKVRFTFSLDTIPPALKSFKILYGESPMALTQEVNTMSAESIKKGDGTYTWYIPNLSAKKWYFKILPLDASDTVIAGTSSEIIDVMVDSNATCTIGNITGLTTTTESSKSILKWDTLTGAMSYNIYKKNVDGTMTLIQNTKDSSYVIYLSSGSLAYSDFGVKALCADGKTESPDATLASKVQTGPALLLFLAIISGLVALFITRRDYFLMGR